MYIADEPQHMLPMDMDCAMQVAAVRQGRGRGEVALKFISSTLYMVKPTVKLEY